MATLMPQRVLALAVRRLAPLLRYKIVERAVTASSPTAAARGQSEQRAIAGKRAWAAVYAGVKDSYAPGAAANNRGHQL